MYALKTKNKYEFFCIAKSEDDLNTKEYIAYNNWRGVQPKGSAKSIKDFRESYERVKVTIDRI